MMLPDLSLSPLPSWLWRLCCSGSSKMALLHLGVALGACDPAPPSHSGPASSMMASHPKPHRLLGPGGPPRTVAPPRAGAPSLPASPAPETAAPASPAAAHSGMAAVNRRAYPWLDGNTLPGSPAVESLAIRFEPPRGFERVSLPPQSFGAWLRGLPLAPPGTPVLTYDGRIRYSAEDPRIGAVVAIDIGTADLQQCADSILRLHAEWCWSQGDRSMSYEAASGLALPYGRYSRGERIVAEGARIHWAPAGRPTSDHSGFRRYLATVFAWANTTSLARQAEPVPEAALVPGDFFVLPGNPGHAVLVLDLARDPTGQRRALLGQGYMPAQSFYVLRDTSGQPWFTLDPNQPTDTPFWEPFPWSSLRRLGE